MRSLGIILATGLTAAAPAGAETILERVLATLSAMDAEGLSAAFANVAENAGQVMNRERTLSMGDTVIIGFDATGAPVTAQADAWGLRVDAATAATLQIGLAAGIYPVGSALYSLPPAGQLSLFEEDQTGQALALAHSLLASRIDGSIRFQAFAEVSQDPEIVAVKALTVTLADPLGDGLSHRVESTVLGAVNSGTVLKGLDFGGGLQNMVSSVTAGTDGRVMAATSGATQAVMAESFALGGRGQGTALALNAASNSADVTGAILLRLDGVNGRVGDIASTVLGAVNNGIVRNPAP